MKKSLVPLVLLAVLALALVAGFLIVPLRHRAKAAGRIDPAELLPPATLAYVEAVDLDRSKDRWSHTALHDLWQEPEVQAFLQRPRLKAPELKAWDLRLERLDRVQPGQAFAAMTTLEGNTVHVVGGLSYAGDRHALEELLAEPRAQLREAFPAGKSDLVPYGGGEIQTYTYGDNVLAEAVREHWYFAANDLATLQAVLDRFQQPRADGGLSADEVFRASVKPLPGDPEVRGFVRVEAFADRISALLAASGQATDPGSLAEWKRQRGLGFATRIQGANLEDAFFLYAPGTPAEQKLPMSGLELTSRDTFLYYTGAVPPDLAAQVQQIPPALMAPLVETLKQAGTDVPALTSSFGKQLSASVEWPQGPHPEFVYAVELAGQAPALHQLLDHLAGGPEGWSRVPQGEAVTYAPRDNESFALATTPRFLLAGLASSVAAALKREHEPHENLSAAPAFKSISASLPAPDAVFAYLDTAALVDHAYGLGRPVLAVALAFNPGSSAVLDASKLPSASALVKHLGATGLSRIVTPDGQLLTARGPITIPQLLLGLTAAGAAALPALQTSQSGAAVWPNFFPSPAVPEKPAAAPAAPQPPVEPAPGK